MARPSVALSACKFGRPPMRAGSCAAPSALATSVEGSSTENEEG
eukprot:CAMPEP_0117591972 /NCGR_PEP_ID=MMETSP0784-20121206/71835_1 /TAXON_ID=39447 /ORGANISM="" /LENGTH=43 /DNA_ID= /DNA_START= /DNA_END= /DNA_ORIENTATION=